MTGGDRVVAATKFIRRVDEGARKFLVATQVGTRQPFLHQPEMQLASGVTRQRDARGVTYFIQCNNPPHGGRMRVENANVWLC